MMFNRLQHGRSLKLLRRRGTIPYRLVDEGLQSDFICGLRTGLMIRRLTGLAGLKAAMRGPRVRVIYIVSVLKACLEPVVNHFSFFGNRYRH